MDPICWRPAAYHQEFSYAHTSSLELLDPELWGMLQGTRRGEIVERGPYLYWRSSRSDVVRRVWVEDYRRVGKRGSPQERVRLYRQEKLGAEVNVQQRPDVEASEGEIPGSPDHV